MKSDAFSATVALALASSIGPVNAQSVDPALGRDIVENQCVSCHKIESHTAPGRKKPEAPSMMDISRMPLMTELSIKVFLRTSHSKMPNIILSPDEIDSVASYIVGLKRRK
jgi:mono/diheme cytochrome c family protein